MALTKAEQFIRTHEIIKARKIASIFKGHKARFVKFLEDLDTKSAYWEKKSVQLQLDGFVDDIAPDVPEYLLNVLPTIMNEGAKGPIKKYKVELPQGYKLRFDIETAPAAKYLTQLQDLMLSQRQGSISKTTRDELRGIMEKGVADGKSYGAIAKEIESLDPWVFSRSRAKVIAVNEVGRAYGWANYEPAKVLDEEGYIMEKIWMTSEDDKVRPEHMENEEAGLIPLGEDFPGTGDEFAPSTNDINCRCTSTTEIVGIRKDKEFHILPKYITDERLKKYADVRVWHTKKVFDK